MEANEIQYEYHTDVNGKRIQPATLALTWKREGGIAGFCDNLAVFLSGEVYAYKCNAETDAKIDGLANLLSASEHKRFVTWITEFEPFTLDASDPKGVSDRMEIVLEFNGMGSSEPSEAEQQAVLNWAEELFQKIYS